MMKINKQDSITIIPTIIYYNKIKMLSIQWMNISFLFYKNYKSIVKKQCMKEFRKIF